MTQTALELDRCSQHVRSLRRIIGVTGVVIATADGRAIAVDLPGQSAGAAAAVTASSLALAARLGELTGSTDLQELQARTSAGYACVHAIGHEMALAVFTDMSINLPKLRLEIRDVVLALRS